MLSFCGWKRSYACFSSVIYIGIAVRDPMIKRVGLEISRFASQELDFKLHMSWSFFLFSELRWYLIFRFVDGGILDHYYLKVVLIIQLNLLNYLRELILLLWTLHLREWSYMAARYVLIMPPNPLNTSYLNVRHTKI